MNSIRSRVGVTVMNRILYAIGGFNGRDRLRTVEVFDSEQNKWNEVEFEIINKDMLQVLGKLLRTCCNSFHLL